MTEWTKPKIIELLQNSDRAIGRALVRLCERQTADEQVHKTTKYQNAMGFRPCHARMGVEMAEFFRARGYLTPKQARYWRIPDKAGNMRIGVYANQLLKVIG